MLRACRSLRCPTAGRAGERHSDRERMERERARESQTENERERLRDNEKETARERERETETNRRTQQTKICRIACTAGLLDSKTSSNVLCSGIGDRSSANVQLDDNSVKLTASEISSPSSKPNICRSLKCRTYGNLSNFQSVSKGIPIETV